MRIIGGKYKGYTIFSQKYPNIRPTSDRARESIFNILRHSALISEKKNIIKGANALDLCCGTGALGFEALSQGAKNVLFVDNDINASKIVKRNIKRLGLEESCAVTNQDATQIKSTENFFSLFFIDPPYKSKIITKILEVLKKQKILKKNAVGIVELGKQDNFDLINNFSLIRKIVVSSSQFLFLKYNK